MLEEYDPYLSNFIGDVGSCISLLIKSIEVILGVFYFIGFKSVEALTWTYFSCVKLCNDLSVLTTIVREEVTEFGESFLKAVLLIFYGIHKIFDSFYITAIDLANLCIHFGESLSRTVSQTWSFITESLAGVFFGVPTQIVEALSMVGDAAINCYHFATGIIQDFLVQLVLSPIKVVLLIIKLLLSCVLIPIQFIKEMPTSSVLGLFVILACAFACRKMLRYLILRNILRVLETLLSMLIGALNFIRFTRLKNIISSTVLTVAKLHDQENSGGYKVACVICQDKPVSFMSNPCKHVCLCDVCVRELIQHDSKCPICRSRVNQYDRVFIP